MIIGNRKMKKNESDKVQIKEIAEKLKLSTSTVSAVLGGRAEKIRISKETQKRVWDLARELNYQPNIYARRLRHAAEEENSFVFAVFWRDDNLNIRLGRFIQGIQTVIKEQNRRVEMIVQPYKPGHLEEYGYMLTSNHIRGAIMFGLLDEDLTYLEAHAYSIPIVLVGRDSAKFHCVTMDSFKAGEQALYYMQDEKLKSAGVISFIYGGRSEQMMVTGFLEGCHKLGILVNENALLKIDRSSFENGYHAMEQIADSLVLPAAIFVADFRLSGGIIRYCQDHNLRVPEDIRMFYFEESSILKYHRPSLSTVDVPIETMAEHAIQSLLEASDKQLSLPIRREIQPVYHIRESAGK